MNRSGRSSGALMLLILMIILAASILSVLGATTARIAYREAQRQAEYSQGRQECVNQANEFLITLRAEMESGTVQETLREACFTDGENHYLAVTVDTSGPELKILQWESYTGREESGLGNLILSDGRE